VSERPTPSEIVHAFCGAWERDDFDLRRALDTLGFDAPI